MIGDADFRVLGSLRFSSGDCLRVHLALSYGVALVEVVDRVRGRRAHAQLFREDIVLVTRCIEAARRGFVCYEATQAQVRVAHDRPNEVPISIGDATARPSPSECGFVLELLDEASELLVADAAGDEVAP